MCLVFKLEYPCTSSVLNSFNDEKTTLQQPNVGITFISCKAAP